MLEGLILAPIAHTRPRCRDHRRNAVRGHDRLSSVSYSPSDGSYAHNGVDGVTGAVAAQIGW